MTGRASNHTTQRRSELFTCGCCGGHLRPGLVLWPWLQDQLGNPDTWFPASGLARSEPVSRSTYLCRVLVLGDLDWRAASAGVGGAFNCC
ncbi:hypothetical protein NDU88_002036 [Pleurodeles waltl]|uniref:Uncharacterized protein n=1 Tax=Pleurodeles waltl TaxID=8319 RepID=A0AAV7NLX4_PLEWA|nr:hypothetical protein NDU88_002036 [Pleurodeles waltl]